MSESDLNSLENRVHELEKENRYLRSLLDKAGISYALPQPSHSDDAMQADQGSRIVHITISKDMVNAFYSYFKGRNDVYTLRAAKPNKKTGKYGYYTQCWNFWKDGICPKKSGMKISCGDCKNRNYKQLKGNVLMSHLLGNREDCGDVVGLYATFPDETCNFLVFDFDNHESENTDDESWKEDVNALHQICKNNGVSHLVERSRSGNGAHLWIFFKEPVTAKMARKFGSALLTKGAESVKMKTFRSYDRMIPLQDHLPAGGLGNLVALPLQGQALKNGNSAFVDDEWNAYPNQWKKLFETQKLEKSFVEEKIKEWSSDGGVLGDFPIEEKTDKDRKKPWKHEGIKLNPNDVTGKIHMTLADGLYIDEENLKPRIQNQLRRFGAYSNPEFYKKQAMGFRVAGVVPRIVDCTEEIDGYLHLPRGCFDDIREKLKEAGIPFDMKDERTMGHKIKVSFVGQLYPEQKKAAEAMISYDNGIMAAATAFGKTVVGAYIIAKKKASTLILVHNSEIMSNWLDDLGKFLHINEELPEYRTKSGRIRKRKSTIGRLSGSHDSLTGIIDIAMIESLAKRADMHELMKHYGLVLMDECHHAGSETGEKVMKDVSSRYVYGLTATPKRDDGQEKKVFMQFGPIRYRFTAKDRAAMQDVNHYVYPRFTRLICSNPEGIKVTDAKKLLISDEKRNDQIIKDVTEAVENGHTPLVITLSREHAGVLYDRLKDTADNIFLLTGQRKNAEKEEIRDQMKTVPDDQSVIVVATGQYIGEGFNFPRLDTMMLTMPVSWSGIVEQYAGRLHRDYEGKKDVVIYDYVDSHIRVLEKMYHKRLTTYRKMGYEVVSSPVINTDNKNTVFDKDNYLSQYSSDLYNAWNEIVVSSPGLNETSVKKFIDMVESSQQNGTKITVVTLDPDGYPAERIEKTRELVEDLEQSGIIVVTKDRMHEHFTLIDSNIVWYGSLNFLSRAKDDDDLIRIENKDVAQELMEITFYKEINDKYGTLDFRGLHKIVRQ